MPSCFSRKRSFGCHSRLLLPPEPPIRSSQNSHNYSNRGQPPLIVMLACWSFGLIGLSQFLQRSVPFFCPNPFQRSLPCSFWSCLPTLTPQNILYPKQECRRSLRKLHSTSSISFAHSVATLALTHKKTTLHSKNSASPAVNGSRPQPSFRYRYIPGYLPPPPSLHSQRLAPLPQSAVQTLHFIPLFVHLLSVGSGLLYLLCFPLRPRTAPDHPPQKAVEFPFV